MQTRVVRGDDGEARVFAYLSIAQPAGRAEELRLLQQRASASLAGDEGAAVEQMAPEMHEQMVNAECIRMLGQRWWDELSPAVRKRMSHTYVATCNAHRWVNVAKGADKGMKETMKVMRAEAMEVESVTCSAGRQEQASDRKAAQLAAENALNPSTFDTA